MRMNRGRTEYRLVTRDEFGIDFGQLLDFRNQREIRAFLAELLRNDAAFAQLRKVMSRCGHHAHISQADRQAVLNLAAEMIFRGNCLRVIAVECALPTRILWTPGESVAPIKPLTPFKQMVKKNLPKRLNSRLPTPKKGPISAQSETLTRAAKNGTPFCAVCDETNNGPPVARKKDVTCPGGTHLTPSPSVLTGTSVGGGKTGNPTSGVPTDKSTDGSSTSGNQAQKKEQALELQYSKGYERDLYDDEEQVRKFAATYDWLKDKKNDVSLKKIGSDDNFLKIVNAERKLESTVSWDIDKKELEVTPIDAKLKVSLLQGQLKGSTLKNMVEGEAKGELLSASAKGKFGAKWKNNEGSAGGDLGVEAVLAKGEASASLRITLKTIFDNTVGRLTNSKLSDAWDKGLSLGIEGEAGLGASAGAHANLVKSKKGASIDIGAKAGAGPMAGLSMTLGIVW